jgi:hypothetical protein
MDERTVRANEPNIKNATIQRYSFKHQEQEGISASISTCCITWIVVSLGSLRQSWTKDGHTDIKREQGYDTEFSHC